MELRENKFGDLIKSAKSKLTDIYYKVLHSIIGMPDERIDRLCAVLSAKDSEVFVRSDGAFNPNAVVLLDDHGLDVSDSVDYLISCMLINAVIGAWIDAQLTLCVPVLKKLAVKLPGVADKLRLEVLNRLPDAIAEKANAAYDAVFSADADSFLLVTIIDNRDDKHLVDGEKVKVKDVLSRIDDLGERSAFAEIAVSLAHSVGDLPDLSDDPDVWAAY